MSENNRQKWFVNVIDRTNTKKRILITKQFCCLK